MKKVQSSNMGNADIPEYYTLREIIEKGTQVGGDKKQFVFLDKEKNECMRTYNQSWHEMKCLGTFYAKNGLVSQSKIAIIGENCYEWMLAYYATLCMDDIVVAMDAKLELEILEDQLIRGGCDALFYSANFSAAVEAFKNNPDMPVKHWFCFDKMPEYLKEGEALLEAGDTTFADTVVKPEDLACIAYTSGTTGKSKGVMLTHRNVAANCSSACRAHTGRHAIGFLPLNHTYAWVSALFSTYIITQWGYLCDSIKNIQRDLKKYQPYNFSGVPLVVETIYDRIWKTARSTGRERALKIGLAISRTLMFFGIDKRRKIFKTILDNLGGNLNMIVCGSANLDRKYEKGMHDFGIEIYNGYGITECSPAVTCNRPGKFKYGSVGTPMDCCEIKIHEPDDEGVGEIYVKGTNVMVGYYNDPEATAEAFDGEWFKTGDYGRIDKDGFLFMVGRKKNLIILSNGKNVSPEELEDKLRTIEYVQEVLVYEEDKKICAEFYLNEEEFPEARNKLKADVNEINRKMPLFKNIQKIKIRDTEFEKTTTLKIVRKNMQKPQKTSKISPRFSRNSTENK